MSLLFYPHIDDSNNGTLNERIDVLRESAERYKAVILDNAARSLQPGGEVKIVATPKDLPISYNWEEIAVVLREIREKPEATADARIVKANLLTKLAEIYEVLRAAKMSKLEAVRLALMTEANQLKGGSGASQVA